MLPEFELIAVEEGHHLTEAARGSEMQQDVIGDLVVKDLIPTLQVQEVQGPVPFPAAWISNATGMRCVLRSGMGWYCNANERVSAIERFAQSYTCQISPYFPKDISPS